MKKYIILIFICVPACLAAQNILTLEQAIAFANNTHPSVRGSILNTEKQKTLKTAAISFKPAEVNYNRGQLNGPTMDNEWEISQTFTLPPVYAARTNLQNEAIELAEMQTFAMTYELEYQVRQMWHQWAFTSKYLALTSEIKKRFDGLEQAARKRFDEGESNYLELKSAENQLGNITLEQQQAEIDAKVQSANLLKITGSMPGYTLPDDAFFALPLPDTFMKDALHPSIQNFEQQVEMAKAGHRLDKSAFWPEIKVGYLHKQIEGTGGFSGMKLGLNIPVLFWPNTSRVKAASLNIDQQEAALENISLTLSIRRSTKVQEVKKFYKTMLWLETNGMALADELNRFAHLAYKSGEIGYIEYVFHLEEVFKLNKSYLEAIFNYNKAVLELQYLDGKFE